MNTESLCEKLLHSFQSQQQQINSNLKSLLSCVQELSEKMSQVATNSQKGEKQKQLESRFHHIAMPFDLREKQFNKQIKIKEWLGELFKRVFSYGFKLYEGEHLTLKQTKVLCSENILYNIIELIRENDLNSKDVEMINNFVKQELLPYFICKYPKSQEKQVNLNFVKVISSVDNLGSNENDLVFRSKVKFSYSDTGTYNNKIMEFMNYLINLPQERVMDKESNTKKRIGDLFRIEIENLFKKLLDKEGAIEMKKFTKSLHRKESKRRSERLQYDENIQAMEYAEKVKSYTSYLIGSKLSKNMENFTENQIKNGDIKIKNSAMMRVLTKWCDQLQENFQNLHKRQYPFRMQDNSQLFLIKDHTIVLSKILQLEKRQIEEQIKKIITNNCQQQELFSKENMLKEIHYLSDKEGKVGIFSTHMLKNNKFYLIDYLNLLIHGLLSATEKFTWFIFSKLTYDEFEDIDMFIRRCKVEFEKRKLDITENEKKYIPSLITFKIGDLLRCKCSSKEYEITALFNQLQRITQEDPGFLKIIRVKNKLTTQTKNILINLLFHNTMVIEMQLAIHSDRSKFIQCSDQFNHFTYELQRAKFGPISELCNIWMAFDPRADFYNKKVKELRDTKILNEFTHTCRGQEVQIYFPFQCDICHIYYNSIKKKKQHKYCNVCRKNVCIYCRINGKEGYKEIRQIFPALPPAKKEEISEVLKPDGSIVEEQIPRKGLTFQIFSKEQKLKHFEKVEREEEKFIFWEQNGKVNLLAQITKQDQLQKFMRNHLIIVKNKNEKEKSRIFQTFNFQHQYFLKEQFLQAFRKEKESIMVNKGRITDQLLYKYAVDKTFSNVKKINFRQNKIENLSNLARLFPNVETAVLTFNHVEQIPIQCEKWVKIKYLYLSKNNLKEVPDTIKQWKQLKVLNLSGNQNLTFISSQISKLGEIQELNFNETAIKTMPELSYWWNLKILVLRKTKIETIPDSILFCKKLKLLNINETQISSLPPSICQCENLEELHFYKSALEELPQNIGRLKKLLTLVLVQTLVAEIPQSIGGCESLQKLHLDKSYISSLPQSLAECHELEVLSIAETELMEFPQFLKKLNKIHILNLSETSITQFPKQLPNLSNIQALYLSRLRLKEIPSFVFSLSSLKELSISQNLIKTLPRQIKNLVHLESFSFYDNCFTSFPPDLNELKKLKYVKISENLQISVKREGINIQVHKVSDDIQFQYLPESISETFNFSSFNLRKKTKSKAKSYQDFESVVEVNLRGWNLNDISRYLKLCTNVKNLNLSKCHLKQVPFFIFQFSNMRILFLNENYISIIPDQISSLTKLEELELQENQITFLPESFEKLQNLRSLKVDLTNPQINIPLIIGLEIRRIQKKSK